MSEEIKEKLGKDMKVTGHNVWKYFGAAFMETKKGHQAISLTRSLAMILFGIIIWKWGHGTPVPDQLLHTFWGLISGKTVETMIAKFRTRNSL